MQAYVGLASVTRKFMTSRFMSSLRTLMPASLRSHSSVRIFRLSGDCTQA